jgi:hypothetical protein
MKRLIGIILLVFAAAGFFVAAKDIARMHGGSVNANQLPQKPQMIDSTKRYSCDVEVFFFYGSAECPTCDIIREEASEVIGSLEKDEFGGDLPRIIWSEVNVEEPGNEKYIFDYGLYTTTIVVLDRNNPERWKRLDEVWNLASNRDRLSDFLRSEIVAFSKGCER